MKTIKSVFTGGLLATALLALGCAGGNSGGNQSQAAAGIPGLDVVAGGVVMSSTNYTLVLTTGEGPGGNGSMSSSSYQLQTGLVRVTQ
jgi:hypothetical protein